MEKPGTVQGKPEEQKPTDIKDVSWEQLGQAVTDVNKKENEQPINTGDVPVSSLEGGTELDAGNQDQKTQTPEQKATIVEDHLNGTPFKSNDELAKGYNNLTAVLNKQGNEIGELRKFKQQVEGQPNVQQQQQSVQTQQTQSQQTDGEVDLYDQGSLKNFIQSTIQNSVGNVIAQSVGQVSSRLNKIETDTNVKAAQNQELAYKKEAVELGSKYPELKLESDMQAVIDIIHSARTSGADDKTIQGLHPDAGKVLVISGLIKDKSENPKFKSLEAAYRFRKIDGDGLEKMLLEANKKGGLETVNLIAKNQSGAETISKVGGQTPQKTLRDISWDELETISNKISASKEY